MAKITALKQQQRNKKRVSVFLDDEFAFGLPEMVAVTLRLGQELTEADIKDLQERATYEAAKQSAMKFVSYRPRSEAEFRRNLRDKAYEEPVIDATIAWLQTVSLCDDNAFARYWIDQRESFKPRSQRMLSMELQQKGIAREIIDDVLGELDEEQSARAAAAKRAQRWLHLPEDQFRLKLGRYLQGRGFNYGVIRQICDEILEEHREDEALH